MAIKDPSTIEKKAVIAVKDWCHSDYEPVTNVIYEPNGHSTAPDFLLSFTSQQVFVEITISGNGFLTSQSTQQINKVEAFDRNDFETSTCKMLLKVNDFAKTFLSPEETIILIFKNIIPLKKRSRLALKIGKLLESIYQSLKEKEKLIIKIDTKDANFPRLEIEVSLTRYYSQKSEYSPVKFIMASALYTSTPVQQASLIEQAKYILLTAVKEKNEKLTKLDGAKWLAIYNTHPLLTTTEYTAVFNKIIQDNQYFLGRLSKLFVICDDRAIELKQASFL
jgi:hypothetical protein